MWIIPFCCSSLFRLFHIFRSPNRIESRRFHVVPTTYSAKCIIAADDAAHPAVGRSFPFSLLLRICQLAFHIQSWIDIDEKIVTYMAVSCEPSRQCAVCVCAPLCHMFPPVHRMWRRNQIATKTYTRTRNCMHQTELLAASDVYALPLPLPLLAYVQIILIYFAGSKTSLRRGRGVWACSAMRVYEFQFSESYAHRRHTAAICWRSKGTRRISFNRWIYIFSAATSIAWNFHLSASSSNRAPWVFDCGMQLKHLPLVVHHFVIKIYIIYSFSGITPSSSSSTSTSFGVVEQRHRLRHHRPRPTNDNFSVLPICLMQLRWRRTAMTMGIQSYDSIFHTT